MTKPVLYYTVQNMVRPRQFDEQTVITQALDVFWENGLVGTSLDALQESTGLNRSSLYATFGNKLNLFCRVLDAYSSGVCKELARPFLEQKGAAALVGYLKELQAFTVSKQASKGCLMVNTGFESINDESVRSRVDTHFRTLRKLITDAYLEGLEDGTVDGSLNPEQAADWLLTIVRGILVGAASNEKPEALRHSIDITIEKLRLK